MLPTSSSVRGCGLKYHSNATRTPCQQSSSVRGCGLKLKSFIVFLNFLLVILRARMWIEIGYMAGVYANWDVILRARMWIEISLTSLHWAMRSRHPPCEDVDWNVLRRIKQYIPTSHPPCEDVDWNTQQGTQMLIQARHPPCEDVDWNRKPRIPSYGKITSSSVRGCGLKFWHSYAMWLFLFVILLARRWIEISLFVSFLLMTFGHPPCEGEGALLIIFTSKAYKKTSVWVDSIIMLYTADIS